MLRYLLICLMLTACLPIAANAGRRLDYQLYRQAEPLPRAPHKRLPAYSADTLMIRINDTILRFEVATRVVLDMFDLHRR